MGPLKLKLEGDSYPINNPKSKFLPWMRLPGEKNEENKTLLYTVWVKNWFQLCSTWPDSGRWRTFIVFCNDRRAHSEHLIEDVEQDDFSYIDKTRGQRSAGLFEKVQRGKLNRFYLHFLPSATPETAAIPLISSLKGCGSVSTISGCRT